MTKPKWQTAERHGENWHDLTFAVYSRMMTLGPMKPENSLFPPQSPADLMVGFVLEVIMEHWKAIVQCLAYEVSDLGRVRRVVTGSHTYIGKILKGKTTHRGYVLVGLFQDGKRFNRRVHRLVAEAFVPNPLNLPEVNHIDGKSNAASNLEWRTRRGNTQHAVQNDLIGDGISYDSTRNQWMAQYRPVPCQTKYIGRFGTYDAAKAARDSAVASVEFIQ
jgi:hypothetical protein